MSKFQNLVILIGIIVIFAGCSTAVYENEASGRFRPRHDSEGTKPPLQVRDENFPETRTRLNNAGIISDSLRYKIAIEGTNSRRTQAQTLEVWAQIRNRTDYPLQVECRVLWFDKDEAPIDNPTAWQRVFLEPNSQETFRGLSTLVHQIAYYYIEIREGQ